LSAKYHLNLVYRAQVSIAQPDYTANCQAAKNAGAQIFYLALDTNSVERAAASCTSISYKPIYVIPSLVTLPDLVSDPHLDGAVAAQNTMIWFNTASPSVAEFQQALKRYAPGQVPSSSGMAGWVSAKLFEEATRNLSEPPSSQSVLDGLWSIKGNDLGGITAPLTFTRDENNTLPFCYWINQIQGGKYVSPNAFTRTCR
jgi:branched-chain amino acid transport system substrate-binding protein